MKDYTAKTLDEAVEWAAKDLGIKSEDLVYVIKEEKKSLFKKTATISVYELADAIEFAENYLKNVLTNLGIEASVKSTIKDEVIKLTINSNSNPILIGKNGKTLQALTELTRLAVFCRVKHRYKLIVEVGDYKYKKYKKITFLAKKAAKEVLQTKATIKLDPMTSDERRMIHSALSKFAHIETVSVGEGKNRAVTIKYVD